MTHDNKREGFSSSFGVLVATLGSAVGLGNIWKFPALTGANGGASFLAVYLLATLAVGLPVMIAEIALGRSARANAVSTFERLASGGGGFWQIIGWMSFASALLIMAFYSEVAGWVYAYVFKAASGALASTSPEVASRTFGALVTDPVQSLIWQWVVLAICGTIIAMGVTRGIEAVTRKLMPLLFILLIVLCIRSLTLPGAIDGLVFLFKPDFSLITPDVVLVALGLAFFKLSIGMGCMLTYGSYFRADQNIPSTALRVMLADLSVSLLAGIAIFPAVFAFGFEPAAGPSLVFMTIPAVFTSMPGGTLFMTLFFVLTAVASVGAILSLLEVPMAIFSERLGVSRRQTAVALVLSIALVGAPAALSNSSMAAFKPFGMTVFDLYDFVTSNLLLPLGGILICLFVAWNWGLPRLLAQISNDGALPNAIIARAVFRLVQWVAPVLIAIVLLHGLKVF
ncbi:MAG: sodium-dependent transporter [Candidatus Dactylopiibacterium sp.]|nr:sodium-dependent transporter [Candidatus Dactylopiibacterium sp.]